MQIAKRCVVMKTLILFAGLLVLALHGVVHAEEESVARKVGRGLEKGAQATARGIEKGADATARGVNRAVEATARGMEKADAWVSEKLHLKTRGASGAAEQPKYGP
jgi:hypothetical protein